MVSKQSASVHIIEWLVNFSYQFPKHRTTSALSSFLPRFTRNQEGRGAIKMGREMTEVTRSLSPFFIRSISCRAGGGGSDGATQ